MLCAVRGRVRPRARNRCALNLLHRPGLACRQCWRGCSGTELRISEGRLREFLQAEVAFFADQKSTSITLRDVLDASTPMEAARLTHRELPIRFAQRIQQIEDLPSWQASEDLVEVHRLYMQSFRALRLVEIGENLQPFTEAVRNIKRRNQGVIPRLATAMRRMQRTENISEDKINEWLDTFLVSRIGMEMLTSQYIACAQPQRAKPGRSHGIVDDQCDPAKICEQAAFHASRLCRQHFGTNEVVRILVERVGDGPAGRVHFPYVPQYLFYVMVELLKNSARATFDEYHGDRKLLRDNPIIVTVGADPIHVGIRVQDQAGGIPFSVADRVWSYMYSTASKSKTAGALSREQGTPLAGYGVGLPLSRLYATYLGGSLHLMSLPGVGTRAYLYLKRLETEAREKLPVSTSLYDPI